MQTNPAWNSFLNYISWIYLFITIWETTHSSSRHSSKTTFSVLCSFEAIILFLFIIDDLMEVIHRLNDQERPKTKHFLTNFKFLAKSIVDISLVIDFILFYTFHTKGIDYFRFGRVLRPMKLVVHSKEMRRQMGAIINTLPNLIDVILLFLLVAVIYAVLGVKLLSEDLTEEESEQIHVGFTFK